jgi:hypothetical protein
MEFALTMLDLDEAEARAVWAPFTDWVAQHSDVVSGEIFFASLPFTASQGPRPQHVSVTAALRSIPPPSKPLRC